MKRFVVMLLVLVVSISACAESNNAPVQKQKNKVEFDLSQLDENGLRGAADGKVSVAYEFCIPDTEDCKKQVRAIDETVQFMPGSKGRIGAEKGQCLCVGFTHQKNFRAVLQALGGLSYIERIIECHFE